MYVRGQPLLQEGMVVKADDVEWMIVQLGENDNARVVTAIERSALDVVNWVRLHGSPYISRDTARLILEPRYNGPEAVDTILMLDNESDHVMPIAIYEHLMGLTMLPALRAMLEGVHRDAWLMRSILMDDLRVVSNTAARDEIMIEWLERLELRGLVAHRRAPNPFRPEDEADFYIRTGLAPERTRVDKIRML